MYIREIRLLHPQLEKRAQLHKSVWDIATEMASHNFSQWIGWNTSSQTGRWSLKSSRGLTNKQSLLKLPSQRRKRNACCRGLTNKEASLHREGMQAEIQSMLDKEAMSLAKESSESFCSQTFPVPNKDSRQRPVGAILRDKRLHLIIYKDDILVMAETESLPKDHITVVVYLLENLGFVINHLKSELISTQEIAFLGFTVNSTKM